MEGFPLDRFSLASNEIFSPLINISRQRKNTCWLAYVRDSQAEPGLGKPFGFFKMTSTKGSKGTVNFYILPYNFRVLFGILGETASLSQNRISIQSRQALDNYLKEIPSYYWPLVRDGMKAVRQGHFWTFKIPEIVSEMKALHSNIAMLAKGAQEQKKAEIHARPVVGKASMVIENVYDIPVSSLLQQLKLIQNNEISHTFLLPNTRSKASQLEKDVAHTVSASEMGNYSSALKRPILRDALESAEERKNRESSLFGNPFKKRKKSSLSRSVQKMSDTDSQDSVMNEADEEGTHHFDNESVDLSRSGYNRSKKFLRGIASRMKKIPSLHKNQLLQIPNYDGLTWAGLKTMPCVYQGEVSATIAEMKTIEEYEKQDLMTEMDDMDISEILSESTESTYTTEQFDELGFATSSDMQSEDSAELPIETWTTTQSMILGLISKWPKSTFFYLT